MPITITNVSDAELRKAPVNRYRIQVNGRTIGTFLHERGDGMAECLRRAADCVERQGLRSDE